MEFEMAKNLVRDDDPGVENKRAKLVKPPVRRANSRGWLAELEAELEDVMELAKKNPEMTWEDVLEGGE